MNRQRFLALLLIETQAAAYALLTGYLAVAALIAALAGCAGLTRTRIQLTRDQAIWVHVLVGVFFFLKYASSAPIETIDTLFLGPSLGVAIVEFLLVIQIGQLLRDYSPKAMPTEFPVIGLLALTCAADNRVDAATRATFQYLVILFMVFAAGYFGASRRTVAATAPDRRVDRATISVMVLLVATAIGWGTAFAFHRHEHTIENFLVDLLIDPSGIGDEVGYSGTSRLGSVMNRKSRNAERIALRVHADDEPGYLRGKAFDRLLFSEWINETQVRSIWPKPASSWQQRFQPLDGQRVFEIEAVSGTLKRLEVWPDSALHGAVFTPDGTGYWLGNAGHISINDHHIVAAGDPLPGFPYICVAAEFREDRVLTDAQAEICRKVSSELDPRIHELAAEIFAAADTPGEKISAVKRYFRENYQYRFGIDVPQGQEALTHFLLDRPPAHCEYFATGAAILLRLGGLPTRYVTGFVTKERNPLDGTWLARNRDFHAWAEAYDGQRWVLVEATPPSGVPAGDVPPYWQRAWETFGFRLFSSRLMVQYGGLRQLGHIIFAFLRHPLTLSFSLVGLVVLAVRLHARSTTVTPRKPNLRLSELHRLRKKMDVRLRRRGIERAPGETLSRFAERLRTESQDDPTLGAAADWYAAYVEIRYGAPADTVQHLERLTLSGRSNLRSNLRAATRRIMNRLRTSN